VLILPDCFLFEQEQNKIPKDLTFHQALRATGNSHEILPDSWVVSRLNLFMNRSKTLPANFGLVD
jgi:hypothetical protein